MPVPFDSNQDRSRPRAPISLRRATAADIPALRDLHSRSLFALAGLFYTPQQIEALMREVGTLDTGIIEDGTYLVAETDGRLVGCGGWTTRAPGYERCMEDADRRPTGVQVWATIRSVFVHPDYARQGIGQRVTGAAEEDAVLHAGAEGIELVATLSGLPLYLRLGYRNIWPAVITLERETLFGMRMAKVLL